MPMGSKGRLVVLIIFGGRERNGALFRSEQRGERGGDNVRGGLWDRAHIKQRHER